MFQYKDNTRAKDQISKRSWTGITPIGVASWPRLNKPESFQNGPLKYSTGLCWEDGSDEVAKLRKAFDEMMEWIEVEGLTPLQKKKGTAVYPLKQEIRPVKDEDGNTIDEEPTGNVKINASEFYKKKDGQINKIPFVDSAGEPISRVPEIHGGSRLRLQVWCRPYYMNSTNEYGVSFKINAVQIVELSAGFSSGPEFGAVEGGWSQTDGLTQAASVAEEDTPF